MSLLLSKKLLFFFSCVFFIGLHNNYRGLENFGIHNPVSQHRKIENREHPRLHGKAVNEIDNPFPLVHCMRARRGWWW